MNDPRFTSIQHDPRFIKPNKNKSKSKSKNKQTETETEVDKRFTKDPKKKTDQIPSLIDYARGRVILESSDEEQDNQSNSDSGSGSDSDGEGDVELGGGGTRARTVEAEIDLDEEERVEGGDDDTPQIPATRRIAIVNLDWDNLNPLDIYKVFSSLLVPVHSEPNNPQLPNDLNGQGRVESVRFYKSQFGKERMLLEDQQGPPKEIFAKLPQGSSQLQHDSLNNEDEDEDQIFETDLGDEFDNQALRQYQLDRLRYFYAIVELNSPAVAQHLFGQIDGTEFERTANLFDLSYVPDEMTFDEADLWDECTMDSTDYQGVDFSTDVLRHSKVKLTWDSEDPIRKKYTRLNTQKLTQEELDGLDFERFIAPGSSDEEDLDREKGRDGDELRKMLGLTGSGGHHPHGFEQDGELEITFKPGFIDNALPPPPPTTTTTTSSDHSKKSRRKKEEVSKVNNTTSGLPVGEPEKTSRPGRSTADQELQLVMLPDLDTSSSAAPHPDHQHRHFDLPQILKQEKLASKKLKKRNRKPHPDAPIEPDSFALDTNDHRFSNAISNDPEFAIDPSNPQFTNTKNMQGLLHSVRNKRLLSSPPSTTTTKNLDPSDVGSLHHRAEDQARSASQLVSDLKKKHSVKASKRVRIG